MAFQRLASLVVGLAALATVALAQLDLSVSGLAAAGSQLTLTWDGQPPWEIDIEIATGQSDFQPYRSYPDLNENNVVW